MYKNRDLKEVDVHTKELINQNSFIFLYGNEIEVFVHLVISVKY